MKNLKLICQFFIIKHDSILTASIYVLMGESLKTLNFKFFWISESFRRVLGNFTQYSAFSHISNAIQAGFHLQMILKISQLSVKNMDFLMKTVRRGILGSHRPFLNKTLIEELHNELFFVKIPKFDRRKSN